MKKTKRKLHPDAAIIKQLGGTTAVSDKLGYDKKGGPQKVNNWRYRGVPAHVKLDHPKMFPHKRKD